MWRSLSCRHAVSGHDDAGSLLTPTNLTSMTAVMDETGTSTGVPARTRTRCEWCGRELPVSGSVGRRRRYCAQACRQRAYENRNALQRGALPPDAVVLSVDERDDLADRLYQVRCAAEDVATALTEGAQSGELGPLVQELLVAARSAERIR
jgi:hypothetical protein